VTQDKAAPEKAAELNRSADHHTGEPPVPAEADDEAGTASMQRSVGPPVDAGVTVPGDSQGVSVPSVQAAAGTSEESGSVDGVTIPALAPPGKPDGEVDTRA
jgi:hypothetical protein